MDIIQQAKYICLYDVNIQNIHGRYWNHMHRMIVGSMGSMRPRSGSYTDPWNSQLSSKMSLPELKQIPDSLTDLLDQRALELFDIATAQQKRIYIMWSGGIDSTVVLTSFLKNLSGADSKIITVVLTEESIAEHPIYFNKYIKDQLEVISYYDLVIDNKFLEEGMVLTGDPADALFGPSAGMYEHMIPTLDHLRPYRDCTKAISYVIDKNRFNTIRQYKLPGFGLWYAQKITDNLLEVQPPGIETIADWWWWHYINFKWESSIWRPLIRRKISAIDDVLSQAQLDDFVDHTFFNTTKFQQWSYSNLKTLIGNDVANHKRIPKKYIYEFDHNDDYFYNKRKSESVPPTDHFKSMTERKPILWDRNWVGYYGAQHPDLLNHCIEHLEQYKG